MSTKGGGFERQVCRQLSLWWTAGGSDAVFYRTAGSGGRATKRGRAGKSTVNHCGDVQASDPVGMPLMRFAAIELKRGYNHVTPHDLLDLPDRGDRKHLPELLSWFAQAEESRRHARAKGWMVIVRRDKRRAVAMMCPGTFAGPPPADTALPRIIPRSVLYGVPDVAFVVCVRLEDYLATVTPDSICKTLEGGTAHETF